MNVFPGTINFVINKLKWKSKKFPLLLTQEDLETLRSFVDVFSEFQEKRSLVQYTGNNFTKVDRFQVQVRFGRRRKTLLGPRAAEESTVR